MDDRICHTQIGMSVDEIKHMISNGFKAAFLPFHQKQAWVRRMNKELSQFIEGDAASTPGSSTSGASTSSASTSGSSASAQAKA